jgi:hypothetical protein
VLYAEQSCAGANCTHGLYGMRTAYKPYGTFSTFSYFYGQPYGTMPYGMVITAVGTVRFILQATLARKRVPFLNYFAVPHASRHVIRSD